MNGINLKQNIYDDRMYLMKYGSQILRANMQGEKGKLENTYGTIRSRKSMEKGQIKVITKLPNSEQSYKGKVKTHNYINRQNQSTTGKL